MIFENFEKGSISFSPDLESVSTVTLLSFEGFFFWFICVLFILISCFFFSVVQVIEDSTFDIRFGLFLVTIWCIISF